MKKRILKNYRYRIANSRHKQYRSNLCKGSFTIEAACVMSIVLLTVMGVIYLSFFVHNRAWLTAAACEASLSGSMEAVRQDGQAQAAAEQAVTAAKAAQEEAEKCKGLTDNSRVTALEEQVKAILKVLGNVLATAETTE